MAPPHVSRLTILSLFLASFVPQVVADGFTQCYYPDGSIPTDYVWEPCIGTGHSSCCIPTEGDVCQDNGLCYYPGTNNTFRGACTDRTWNDPACPKDLCVAGNEDTWAWASPCSSNNKDVNYACGHVEDNVKVTANCTGSATTFRDVFHTVETTSSKPTRYTSPSPIDTAKFTVYTEKHTTVISAWVQQTTKTTTWEVTITSALGQQGASATGGAGGGATITGPRGGFTSSGTAAASTSSSTSPPASKGITMSPGVLGAAIAGPVVGIALLAGLFFFLRKKRAAKNKGGEGSTRLHSSPSGDGGGNPPANGPVGNEQVVPYEVPANEAAYGHDRKYVYTGTVPGNDGNLNGAYEMGAVGGGEKNWGGVHSGAQEVPADERQQQNQQYNQQYAQQQQQQQQQQYPNINTNVNNAGVPSPIRSPAPVYSELNGPAVLPVELDGGQWGQPQQRPAGSNRNGVGNA